MLEFSRSDLVEIFLMCLRSKDLLGAKMKNLVLGTGLNLVLVLGLTGCQGDPAASGGGYYGAGAVPPTSAATPPVLMPAADPVGQTKTSSSTRSWTSADGTQHTSTTTTSSGITVNPNAAGAVVAGLAGGNSGGAAAQAANYAGKWNVSAAGRNCSMTLRAPVAGGNGGASTFGCFGSNLMQVSGWSLRGYELVLTGFNKPVATLRVTQPNRMDGQLAEGGAVTAWR